jgi:hypothetical protein
MTHSYAKNIEFVYSSAKLSCYLEEKYQIYADEARKYEKKRRSRHNFAPHHEKKQSDVKKL